MKTFRTALCSFSCFSYDCVTGKPKVEDGSYLVIVIYLKSKGPTSKVRESHKV